MDTDAGANPFGHSCLIFSRQEKEKSPVEVVDGVGFYSQPSTTTNPFFSTVKAALGLNVDLQDGHGVLKQESMHELDGKGLHGISFEVTEEQFHALNERYISLMKTQQQVMDELNAELTGQGIEANGFTRFDAEKAKAAAEGREPRLKPFHITMEFTLSGLDSSASYTCKDYALDLLTEHQVISGELKNQFNSNTATKAFPAFSDLPLHPIHLISTGMPEKVTSKRTGQVFYNHVWGKNSLYWASPVNTYDHKPSLTDDSLKDILYRIPRIEYRLYETIRKTQEEEPENKEYLYALNIQLKRVQNLAFLFNNTHDNQNLLLLQERLKTADKVLNIATFSMNQEKMNYSFLLRAYESVTLHEALLGILIMAVSATILTTPVGIGLFIAGTSLAAYQLHGFYAEETQRAETKKDYELYQQAHMA